jgi:molybdopterin biosynthesis enzyme MoaB
MSTRVARAAVLTISSSRAGGARAPDESGDLLATFAESIGADVVGREVVADDRVRIEERLRHWTDEAGCDLC